MQWVVTGLVLASVSLLVVTLTIEQAGKSIGDRSALALTRTRSVLLRALLSLRSIAMRGGVQLNLMGRNTSRWALTTAVDVRKAIRSRERSRAEGTLRRYRLRFEECMQVTAPSADPPAPRSTLLLAPMPAPPSWPARLRTVAALAVMIVVAGGVLAVALAALGWKAAHLF